MNDFINQITSKNQTDIQKFLTEIIGFSSDGIIILDNEGVIVVWNEPMETITGWKAVEVLGKYIWDVQIHMYPDQTDKEKIYKNIKSIFLSAFEGSGALWDINPKEFAFRTKNNEIRLNLAKYQYIELSDYKYIVAYIKDITESRKNEEIVNRRIHELEYLSTTSAFFADVKEFDSCFEFLSDNVLKLSECDYLVLSSADNDPDNIRIRSLVGLNSYLSKIKSISGMDLMNTTFIMSEASTKEYELYTNRRMNYLEHGIYRLANKKVPFVAAKIVENFLDINKIYTMGLTWDNTLFGGVTIGFKKGRDINNINLLENIINQAAVAIHRLRTEDNNKRLKLFYENILETVNEAIFVTNPIGEIIYTNPSFNNIFELDSEKNQKINLTDNVPVERFSEYHKYILQAIKTLSPVRYDIKVVTLSENIVYLQGWIIPIVENGKLINVLSTATDITENKKNQDYLIQSEKRFKRLFNHAPLAYQLMDESGNILDVNDAWLESFGYNRAEIVGTPLTDLLAESYKNRFNEYYSKFIDAGEIDGENCEFLRKSGSTFHAKIFGNVSSEESSRKRQMHCVLIDTSIQNLIEEQIKQVNIELETKFDERTRQFQKALNDLMLEIDTRKKVENDLLQAKKEIDSALEKEKEISQIKSRFISLISHEYRTPLSVILSSSEIIDTYNQKIMTEFHSQIKKHVVRINNSVQHLTDMMENVVILKSDLENKIEPKTLKLDILEIFRKTIDSINILDQKKHILIFNTELTELIVNTDSNFIGQILNNLLLNAVKYSNPGTEVHISLADSENEIKIQVSDNGFGIEEDELPSIYEPFFKGKKDLQIKKGIGLGLSITKRYVEALNGKISAESKVGIGTTFTIIFPK